MTTILFVAGALLLCLPGTAVARSRVMAGAGFPGRLAISFAAGTFIATLLMYALSLLRVPWSRTVCGSLLIVIALLGVAVESRSEHRQHERCPLAIALGAITTAIFTYALVNARATTADLLFFWGPKAQAFFAARRIDPQFLADRAHYLMHMDYPPYLPLLYAWGALVAQRMSWWGAVFLTLFFLLASVAFFRGMARRAIGGRAADRFAVLMLAMLAFAYVDAGAAGGADPALVMYETIALSALTFGDPSEKSVLILVSLALAAIVFTKVEGVTFVAVFAASFLVTRRQLRPLMLMLSAPVLVLGSWLIYARHYGLLNSYVAQAPLHIELLPRVIRVLGRHAHYEAFYLPWAAVLLALAFGRRLKPAVFPLLVAAGSLSATVYFYLHDTNPDFWIAASAGRVLTTVLMCLAVAAAAAQVGAPAAAQIANRRPPPTSAVALQEGMDA